jgi:hypothetical protein
MAKAKPDHQKTREEQAKAAPADRVYPPDYKPDETIKGGRYFAKDGKTLRNAHGQHIEQTGAVLPSSPVIEEPQIPTPEGLAPPQP